ncbi:MAG: serine/threonine protein kinase, partial [Planctomycetota bacterium]
MRVGPYELLEEIGTGGMGTVHLAKLAEPASDEEAEARLAVKIVHPHLLATPGFFKRFLREGELGQRVRHENVVATLDVDGTEVEGKTVLFLTMEYVEGQNLRSLIEELGTVPEELCRHIGREVAKGLGAIHGADAIHRDLKPENVLITEDHQVKLMDLGVSRLKDEQARLSQDG